MQSRREEQTKRVSFAGSIGWIHSHPWQSEKWSGVVHRVVAQVRVHATFRQRNNSFDCDNVRTVLH